MIILKALKKFLLKIFLLLLISISLKLKSYKSEYLLILFLYLIFFIKNQDRLKAIILKDEQNTCVFLISNLESTWRKLSL